MKSNPSDTQQKEKMASLKDLLAKYITKIETAIENQQASIQNLENQVGQIAAALSNRSQGTLPSDTEKYSWEQMLAVEVVNYAVINLPSNDHVTPIKAFVLPITFPQAKRKASSGQRLVQ